MRGKYILVFVFLYPVFLLSQENEYDLTLSGFVSYETVFDTRQTVTAREGDVLLYPSPVVKDLNGKDINGQSSFNMFSIHSRLRTKVSGPQVLGAESSALVEVDFAGTTNSVMSMMRLRHAIIKLDWEKSLLLAGQYWHPLFVTGSYPEVSSWGGGLPYAILSRNPQIRFKHHFGQHFFGSITVLGQRDFASPGPNGPSSEYLRNSSKPELDLHLEYHKNGLKLGTVLGYKEVRPRLQDENGQAVDETLGSAFGSVYARKDWSNFTAKVKAVYGENLYNFLMLGGYASYQGGNAGELEYSNYETGSVWTELIYNKNQFIYSLFAGYTENMGVNRTAEEGLDLVNKFARGTDIAYAYRISPRLGYRVKKFLIMGEILRDVAAYGEAQPDGEVLDAEEATNIRVQLHLKYSF